MSEKTIKADHVVDSYRGYKIVAGKQKGECKGVVWDGGEQVHTCSAGSLDDAMREMKNFLDQDHDQRLNSRTTPPSGKEYVDAFRKILNDLADNYVAMLKAHYHAPDQTLTATELAEAAGYSTHSSANLHYGKVGKLLSDVMPIVLEKQSDGTPVYTSALATPGERTIDEQYWTWKLRPEVAFAIKQLGLAA
jgi:hypothetical protein